MKCGACGHENREGAKFCRECAVPLADATSCPKCGTPSERGQKFCDSCGHRIAEPAKPLSPPEPRSYTPRHLADKILTTRSALEGERKQVTVLFADVWGSLAAAPRSGGRAHPPGPFFRILTAACIGLRARSTSTPATASWPCSVRPSRTKITRCAPATRRSIFMNTLRSWSLATSSSVTRVRRGSRDWANHCIFSSSRAWAGCGPASTCPARGFTKFVGRQSEMAALEAALEKAIGGTRRSSAWLPKRGQGKAASVSSLPSAAARGRSQSTRRTASPTGRPYRYSRSLSSSEATSASPSTTHRARPATRSPDGCCCSTKRSPRGCRSCSISSVCQIPSDPLRNQNPKRGSGASLT